MTLDPPNDDDLIGKIRAASRQLVRELDVVDTNIQGTGCTLAQCHVLVELSIHKTLGLLELADILLIDKSNASRTVKSLVKSDLVQSQVVAVDQRQKKFSLTKKGRSVVRLIVKSANQRVESALEFIDQGDAQKIYDGLRIYNQALSKIRLQANFQIRPIKKKDNSGVARVIQEVMTEFDAVGPGYSIGDEEVACMHQFYRESGHCYYVIENAGDICGGGGIGPLAGGERAVCELRKMFFLPNIRGLGLGRKLLKLLLNEAKKMGYQKCYLETLDRMPDAIKLYEGSGFARLKASLGDTGHCQCNRWYLRSLD